MSQEPSRADARPDGAPPRLERAATWLSIACAIHCLLVPAATALLPLFDAAHVLELGGGFHVAFTLLVVASAGAAAAWGFRRHRDTRVTAAMLVGLLVYLLGHGLDATTFGTTLSIAGALALGFASFASARLGHVCSHEGHAH